MVAVISSLLDTKDDGLFRSWFSQAITALLVKETRKDSNSGRRKDIFAFCIYLSSESILTAAPFQFEFAGSKRTLEKIHGRPSLVGPITSLRVEKWFDYYL